MKCDYTLYLCTDTKLMSTKDIEESVEEAILGGVTVVQVREKEASTAEFLKIAKKVQKITRKHKIPLIINDRIDIAMAIDADGVHLGQNDMPCDVARNMLGPNKIIGISVTNAEQAIKAKFSSADYIGVGAMFKSKTKPEATVVPYDELIKIINSVDLPIVLIGGINKYSIPLFKNLEIDGYAMITPIISQTNIKKSTQELLTIIKQNKE